MILLKYLNFFILKNHYISESIKVLLNVFFLEGFLYIKLYLKPFFILIGGYGVFFFKLENTTFLIHWGKK